MHIHQQADALLLIDLQPDFMPGGPLAVAGGDKILPAINALARRFDHVLLTQDWHPPGHISFASTHARPVHMQIDTPHGPQMLWPDHCLQGSPGAALAPALDIPHAELVLRKGFRRGIDSYSAFLENDHITPTGLAGYLRERGLRRLFLAGLAYDFCVRFSAVDGKHLGFDTVILRDLTRAVDQPGSVQDTEAALAEAGIPSIHSTDLVLEAGSS